MHTAGWGKRLAAQPGLNQPAFNTALKQSTAADKVVGLPQRIFPNGMQFFTQMYSKKDTALVHNNYIIGYEQKPARF